LNLEAAIELFAELALGLAGFAGVASAFAGRERRFRAVERLRLVGVVGLSACTFGGCLAYVVCSVGGLSGRAPAAGAAFVTLVLLAPLVLRVLPEFWRRSKDADAQVDGYSPILVSTFFVLDVILLGCALTGVAGGWALALAFSLLLLHGLWLFFLLLTREN